MSKPDPLKNAKVSAPERSSLPEQAPNVQAAPDASVEAPAAEPGALPTEAPEVPAAQKVVKYRVLEKTKAFFCGGRQMLRVGTVLDESSLGKDVLDSIKAQGVKLERIED